MENRKFALTLILALMSATATSAQETAECPVPDLAGNTFNVIDIAPLGAVIRVTVAPTSSATSGWSAIVIFSSPLDPSITVESYSAELTGVSPDGTAFTFSNRPHNSDISSQQQYAFTFIVKGTDVMNQPTLYSAIVGFYDAPVTDGSCFLDINPTDPLPSTSSQTSTTQSTTQSSTTSTTQSTTTTTTTTQSTTTTTTPTPSSGVIPQGCEEIDYMVDNGWIEQGIYKFSFRYRTPTSTWSDWVIKIVFERPVTAITTYTSVSEGPKEGGLVWFFRPMSWNHDIQNQHLEGNGNAETTGTSNPNAVAIICNNGVEPDTSLIPIGGSGGLSTASTTSTTPSTTSSTSSSTSSSVVSTITPPGTTGQLPDFSAQTAINFKQSSAQDLASSVYDYNEILHKSILFYEAQRSGKLPVTNRIPWRGDSGLQDGCYSEPCLDLTGGWYDAGDFVKFGFPMAYSTTVLAWGMIEFRDAYEDAEEWENALDMLKWATDYFVKAHVSANELYVQVGNPGVDHSNWGHPETMTMDRPAFKIDEDNPGTEVAAETAAALAASYMVFLDSNPEYAAQLLSHAMQLYDFAQQFRGNYHESLPESDVSNFYKSWSGYNDELVWGAMWLHRATGDPVYLSEALDLSSTLNPSEFSWDQKSPGALVLLSQQDPSFKSTLYQAIDNVMGKSTTPAGLTFFSEWGTNRYAANYALIALMAAKMEGSNTVLGQTYYNYGMQQIHNMLGDGDNSRSYVVGFGMDSPTRPHHRSSSCREWTLDPASRVCDWTDKDADGPNPQILYGALVGGPGEDGSYVDDRGDFVKNEVAVDYNAGFQSAVAGLKHFLMQA